MSHRRSSSDLGSSAEATLGAFPFPERDWESDARAIEARLTDGLRGSTEASLLAAPLPNETDEPSSMSASATPLTNSGVRTQSLAELARRSVEKKQANERQMVRESLAIAAQQRQVAPRIEAAPVPAPASANHAPVSKAQESAPVTGKHALKIAIAFPALALAAAALFWFRRPEPAPLVTNSISQDTPSVVATAAIAEARPAATATPDAPRGIDPSTLPATQAEQPEPTRVAVPPSKAVASKLAVRDSHATLAAEGVDKSLPPDPSLRPADSRGTELPNKPSTGAVQVALGSVLGGARHCVAGDDAPSSAVVVFGSDGRVQRVTVSGAAAGSSAASCIEAQLSRARVQPFAASNFSVNATVRPE